MPATVLIKGDISGIQNFIFNTPGKGAAKSLKGRSFFIHALPWFCLFKFHEVFKNSLNLISLSGGNFYFTIPLSTFDENVFNSISSIINNSLHQDDLYVVFNWRELAENDLLESYGTQITELTALSQKGHLQKYKDTPGAFDILHPEEYQLGDWKKLTESLLKASGFTISSEPDKEGIQRMGVSLNLEEKLSENNNLPQYFDHDPVALYKHNPPETPSHQYSSYLPLKNSILNCLPVWTKEMLQPEDFYYKAAASAASANAGDEYKIPIEANGIINFVHLAAFAGYRTGTTRMAVLKMDVDNLGALIKNIKRQEQALLLSQRLGWFFDTYLYHLWAYGKFTHLEPPEAQNHEFISIQHPYRHNIYVVYSGGDDCFFLGAWDAIYAWGLEVHKAFTEFAEACIRNEGLLPDNHHLTLSASLIPIDEKLPVVKFATLAEEELNRAKLAGKDRISFLNHVFTWKQIPTIIKAKDLLHRLIACNKESRSLLRKLTERVIEYPEGQPIQDRNLPPVHRLHYSVGRTLKNIDFRKELETRILDPYQQALIRQYLGQENDAFCYPVAARWAEYLTKNL